MMTRCVDSKFCLVIHGGCGLIPRHLIENTPPEQQYRQALRESLLAGFQVLKDGGAALEAVIQAIKVMEDSPLFNAGKGSVFSSGGVNEMDAGVMIGSGQVGGVSTVIHVKNPIVLAKEVMLHTPHALLCGDGAEAFGKERGVATEPLEYFQTERRMEQLKQMLGKEDKTADKLGHTAEPGSGTVGACAVDGRGELAAGSSTGGMTGKAPGRVSDSSIAGAGFFCDSRIALSGTGNGDFFIRRSLCKYIGDLVRLKGLSLEEAGNVGVSEEMTGCHAGVVGVDSLGGVAMPFNTEGMFRGWIDEAEKPFVAIWDH